MEKQSTRKFLKLIVALVALFLLGASALMLASCNKDEHQHSYTGSVTTPATCSNPGVETFTCSCGAAYTQIIPATNDHAWEKIKVYANSCESEGWTVYECSVCHEQKQDDWTPKLDHKYEAVETVEATCTEDGYQIMQCSYCKSRYTDAQYSAEHKATGHKWIVNESPADPADLTDAEGWKVVKAADCLNAAQLQRTCSVCGDTEEKVGAAATGHKIKGMEEGGKYADMTLEEALKEEEKFLCKPDTQLIDAEGNKVYAFECANENCPVEVKVDARGTTKHFIKAVDHKMQLDTDPANGYVAATCETEGNDVFKCSVCQTVDADNKTEKLGHKYNTVQSNGTDDVVVCIEDKGINTQAKYLAFMRSLVGNATFNDNQNDYVAAWNSAYDKALTANNGAAGTADDKVTKTLAISQVCTRCGAPTAAIGHNYVVAKYVEGSFTDVEKDEDGAIVDYSEEVNVATMNCRYVQICSGCGDVAKRGAHQNVSAATCRAGGVCPDCGRQVTAQLDHKYVNVNTFVNADGTVKPGTAPIVGKITNQDAYNAWKTVSATETWMVPVVGDCDSKTTTVYVCVQCLVDAAKGTEVVWNQATEVTKPVSDADPTPAPAAVKTNAYVITLETSHDYQPTYYDLDGTKIEWNMTNCQVGFMIRYECSKCGEVFKNVAVGDDPATTAQNTPGFDEKGDLYNEARNNEAKVPANLEGKENAPEAFFTDEEGFVLDTSEEALKALKVTGDDVAEMMTSITVAQLAGVAQEDNKDKHSLYLTADYKPIKAATCATVEIDPYYCENCGQVIEMAAGKIDANGDRYYNDTETATTGLDSTFTYAEVTDENGRKIASTELDKTNHAGKPEDCGTHCDYKVNNAFACTGYSAEELKNQTYEVSEDKTAPLSEMSHKTVTVVYSLTDAVSTYYANYTVKVANVGTTPKSTAANVATDINNYITSFEDGTKVAACGSNEYEAPLRKNFIQSDGVTAGKYLVLVDEEGTAYQFIDDDGSKLTFYNNDDGTAAPADKIDVDKTVIVKSDDIFFVHFSTASASNLPVAAPVSASDSTSLGLALGQAADPVKENGKDVDVLTVEVAKSFTLESVPKLPTVNPGDSDSKNAFRVVFDLNGNTLTIKTDTKDSTTGNVATGDTSNSVWYINGDVRFTNGNITFAKPESAGADAATSAFDVNNGASLTLENVVLKAFDTAIRTEPTATAAATINVKNSTIISDTFGITTNATNTAGSATAVVTINVEGSTISMNPDAFGAAGKGTSVDNAAMLINVPSKTTIKDSTLTANRQVIIARGAGDVNISNTTLNLVEGYLANPESGYPESDMLEGKWGEGNRVSHAALTIGNDNSDAYQSKTTVILSSDVKINVPTGVSKVFIASDFTDKTLTTVYNKENGFESGEDGYLGENEATKIPDGKMPVMVYLNGGGVLSGSDITYVLTWDKGTTQLVNCGDMSGIR